MLAPPSLVVADQNAAFHAVMGGAPPVVETLPLPGGDEQLAVAPVALTAVGRGRYALIIRETNGRLPHSAVGAASVAYVERAPIRETGLGWRKIGLWPQIALNGDSGGEELKLEVRRDLGARPLLFVSGRTLATGDAANDAIVIRLDPESPTPIGRISLLGSNEDAVGKRFARHSYRGRVVPTKAPDLFAVQYDGWRAAAGSAVKQRFHGTVSYRLRAGCLTATGPLPAPEVKVDYSAPSDCGPAKSAARM